MQFDNEMKVKFKSKSENESFARIAISGFLTYLDPMVSDLTDIKTAVSEAVTNSIIHAYGNEEGFIEMICKIKDRDVYIEVIDEGKGIDNVEMAKTPLFTTKPEEERSGMGFTVMETFMDHLDVISFSSKGTIVKMKKTLVKC